MTELPFVDSGFAVPIFSPGDNFFACLDKVMAFLTAVASSSNATSYGGNNSSGQARVVKCYNCQGEEHMARQCTQPKRPRNAAWYKDKAMLAEAQEAGQILDEEQLAFLADRGVPDGQVVQTIIPNNAAFQTEDLDTCDSDYDDISNAQAVLMANISNYGSDVILEVSHSETNLNDMENQSVLAMQDFKQSLIVDFIDNEIHSDSNIILYSQYLQETQQANVQDTNLQAQQDLMILSVIEQMINHVNNWEKANKEQNNKSVTAEEKIALKEQVDLLEQNLSKQIKEKECYQNPFHLKKAQRIKPALYDGIVMSDKHVDMPVIDGKETLILEEESRSKMSEKAKDPKVINKNISHKPVDYENKPSDALPVKIKAPKELSKISLVNESLKKLKFHLAKFDNVVKIRTTPNARTEVKAKEIVDIATQIPSATTIVPGMFKLDLEPLAPRLLQNREAHLEHLMYTQEQADILRGIVKQAKVEQPLDKELDFAYKHAQRIQELLVYVRDACSNAINLSAKKVAVTPKNKVKKVRLKCSTSKCGSKPIGNKRNDRISQTPSRNMKNKKSMFDGVHDMCFLEFVKNVNSRAKSAKKHKKENIWKPTGNVFTKVGFKWKPTGKTFTIVGNSCPLTRITSANVVPPKITTSHSVEIQKPELKVYSRKPKNVKNVGSSKTAKIVESKNANHSEPNHTWGSNATDIPSSSSLVMIVRFGNDNIARIIGYGDYQLGHVTISRDKKLDLSFFHVFGALCYPTNDNDSLVQEAVAPRSVVLVDSLMLTSIDQDAPSSSTPSIQEQV
ncbi:integrase, catalytic region, zinc finger, CCHC-type containing protein [Tanacetum coccineum]